MKQIILILTFLTFSFANLTIACDCDYSGDFLTVAPKKDLVAIIKVIKYLTFETINNESIPMSMEVEIIKIINGEEERKSIIVWGDNGILCRPYLSKFKIDKYYAIAFDKESNNENQVEYSISICGAFWLTADNESKTVQGSISSTLKSMSYGELWEYFHEEKTKELTPTDFKEIFQLAFDLPKLQQYYHVNNDSSRKQIYLKYFGDANHNNLIDVKKFDLKIIIFDEEEILKQKIKFYFVVGDWVCGLSSVRMQLNYVGEGITVSYMFKKIDDKWTIDNSELWEE